MKKKIIEVATSLFLDLGFKSVTMDDLAKEMAISKKTIYSFFENKTQLVKCCTEQLSEVIYTEIADIQQKLLHPIEELFEIRQVVRKHLKNEKSSPQYQLQKYFPKLYESQRQGKFEMMYGILTQNLKRGIEVGCYRPELDLEFTARIYFFNYMSFADKKVYPDRLFDYNKITLAFLDYHVRGIASDQGLAYLNQYQSE